MKAFDVTRINQAETAQLIILHSIFALRQSKDVIFQGGTAIRWFYGGMRFSEDLDFVTSLTREQALAFIQENGEQFRRQLVGNFGTGTFTIKTKKSRESAHKSFVEFIPATRRAKISVKVEFEGLGKGMIPDFDRIIMQSSPTVSYFLREGSLKTPGSPVIINVETPGEILSDKLRALMERPHTRGRDFFDVWFLSRTLQTAPDAGGLKRKLEMYEAPFCINTPPSFYENLEELDARDRESLVGEINADLGRFLSPEILDSLSKKGFQDLLSAVQEAFRLVVQSGMIDFTKYSSSRTGLKL